MNGPLGLTLSGGMPLAARRLHGSLVPSGDATKLARNENRTREPSTRAHAYARVNARLYRPTGGSKSAPAA